MRRAPAGGPRGARPDLGAPDPELQPDGRGSAWDTAEKRRADEITVALDEFYKAYSAAFQGSTGTAKGHADKGKDAQANIAEAEQRLVAELKLVDSKAGEIQAAIDALEAELKTTETTCEGVAP